MQEWLALIAGCLSFFAALAALFGIYTRIAYFVFPTILTTVSCSSGYRDLPIREKLTESQKFSFEGLLSLAACVRFFYFLHGMLMWYIELSDARVIGHPKDVKHHSKYIGQSPSL